MIFTRLYNILKFLDAKIKLAVLFVHRVKLTQALSAGPHGPCARPRWPAWPRTAMAMAALAGKHGGGAPARETERKKVQEKQQLTLSSPEVVAWPEMSRRRRIWRRRRSGPASESATASAIPGVLARFFGRGDRGRRGESSQQLSGARGGS
jgi:hypothetical protein